MKMNRLLAMLLCTALMMIGLTGFAVAEEASEDSFSLWNADAPALNALIEYVEAVTEPDSPDFIPEADRIATFDMDGTLMGELFPTYLEVMLLTERILADPSYEPDAEMLAFGRMTRDHALDKSFPDDYDYEFSYHQARAFAGMTLPEYSDFITRFLTHEADGFTGMTYADAYYLPMVEVVDYLQDNGFKCYVVSGSDRFIVRTFIEGAFDIPAERVIGSDTALAARNQGDTDGIEYVFTGEDELVRTDELLIKDLKTNKVVQIAQEIGRQPVLSFGNSSGDVSMNNYALLNNRYRSAAFMLVADDDVRDYGNPDKHDELTFLCGHDSNVATVLSALGVTDYALPETIEKRTPIGVKLLFETWSCNDGEAYARVRLVYASTEQLRGLTPLTLAEPPVSFAVRLPDVEMNADGYYRLEDVYGCLQNAIDAYDAMAEQYGDADALADAA